MDDLALAIEQGEIAYIPDQTLIMELQAIEAKTTSTGHPKYEAPSGMHDDTVMSLALAWKAASSGRLALGIA